MHDRELLLTLLTRALLTPDQLKAFQGALLKLEMGLGKLPVVVRRHAEAVLRAQGLLARGPEKPKRAGVWEEDRFSAVRTKGTQAAEALLAQPLPLKPPRKAS